MSSPSCCPYLAIKSDPLTRSACLEIPNYCHKLDRPRAVRYDYQLEICRNISYPVCPLLSGAQIPDPLIFEEPERLPPFPSGYQPLVYSLAVIALLALAAVLLTAAPPPAPPQTTPSPRSTVYILPAPATPLPASHSPLPTLSSPTTPSPLPTSSSPSPLPTASPGPQLATPFGAGPYLVHRVREGESYEYLAALYRTSIEVLTTLNRPPTDRALFVGSDVVVAPATTSTAGLVALQPLFLEKDTPAQDLAAQYNVPLEELRRHNAITTDLVTAPRWIVIPK